MTAIRQTGKINENTTLIDVNWLGMPRMLCIYLIESGSGRKCLIDAGPASEARRLVKKLDALDAFPPDIIIITHSHFDHTQAIPYYLKKAERLGKQIEIMASKKAIPYLEDQSYNQIYGPFGPFKNIKNAIVLKEGDRVDLDDISLKILDVPGHSIDHIAIFDEKNKNLFIGDAIGSKTDDNLMLTAIVPPHWNTESYLTTIDKLKQIDFNGISLAHFGYIYSVEAKNILDEALSVFNQWWNLLKKNTDNLDNIDYMLDVIIKEIISNQYGEVSIKDLNAAEIGLIKIALDWIIRGYKAYNKLK